MSQVRPNYRRSTNNDKVVYLSKGHRQPSSMAERVFDQVKPKRNWRWLVIAGIGIIAIVFSGMPLITTYQDFAANQSRLEQVKAEYEQAQADHSELMTQSQLVQDPEYLAEIARRDYYYSKPGETIFKLDKEGDIPE